MSEVSYSIETAAKRQPEVQSEVEMLEKACMNLSDKVGVLSARLALVMRPREQTLEKASGSPTPAPACELSGLLQERRESVIRSTRILEDIIDALEV